MIAIVDYGLGNVQAIANIYSRLGIPAMRATQPKQLREASRILLTGVGAFDWAMSRLDASGMRKALDDEVQVQGKPVLGICVGMQMMARSSEEGSRPGLGWIDAVVQRFRPGPDGQPEFLPHMGWNDVRPVGRHALFRGMDGSQRFYFLHSYYVKVKSTKDVIGEAEYGAPFACAVASENVACVQFHPEKSHAAGIELLRNFAEA